MKRCSCCGERKPPNDFVGSSSSDDGLHCYCRLCHGLKGKKTRVALRTAVLAHLGDECCWCGFSDPRALQIDHINGGGRADRASAPGPHSFMLRVLSAEPGVYQLLCANCNQIKKVENNEHRGG